MPRRRTAQRKAVATVGECEIARYADDDSESVGDHESVHSQTSEAETRVTGQGESSKRKITEARGSDEFGDEMQKMLEGFGADVSKTMNAKRKRIEQVTNTSIRSSNKRLDEIWKMQQSDRKKMMEEFQKQSKVVLQQMKSDFEKFKDHDEKIMALIRAQQKTFQQTKVSYGQRVATMETLYEHYSKGMEELEKNHHMQQGSMQSEIKREMVQLQKKITTNTQKQEMANMRKSLETMFF